MKYGGNIYSMIHRTAASVQAALLSLPATYTKSDGTTYTVYMTPEPINSLTTYGVLSIDSEQFITRYKIFTVVLEGQEIDFVANHPKQGDVIEIEINGVTEKWFVVKGASASCWGHVDGNEKIWILTSKFDPRK